MHKRNMFTTAAVFLLLGGFLFFACEQPSGQEDGNTNQKNQSEDVNEGENLNEDDYEYEDELEEIPPPELTGIELEPPDTLIYALGQPFDTTGLKVRWTYDDGSTTDATADEWRIANPPDTSRATTKLVTVTAGDYSKTFQITVRNDTKVLQSIAITTPPTKTAFEFGEELDTAGMYVTGTFYDTTSEGISTSRVTVYKTTGYNKIRWGEQTITVSTNGKSATYTVTVTVPASAEITITFRKGGNNIHFLKGQPFTAPKDLLVKIVVNGITTYVDPTFLSPTDFSGCNTGTVGTQTLTLTLGEKSQTFNVLVLAAEPHVFFDYGYMRLPSDPTGIGAGAGKYYTKPGVPLTLSVVRFLVGYDENNTSTPVTYSWSVPQQAGAYTASAASGEYFTFTPSVAGTYRVKAAVTGRSYIDGATVTREAETEVVCYTGTVPTTKTFPDGAGLRNFAPGQFTVSGTGLGWSLGAQGGYRVWRVGHQASYYIQGNAFGIWNEPGVVWVMEDNNGNNIPDEMWYELKGGEDDTNPAKITRRYAVQYFHADGETLNEYGQMVMAIPWVDSKGRSGSLPGGWPRAWGVADTEDWVMYTGTTLRDTGEISDANYGRLANFAGYVDDISGYYDGYYYSGYKCPINRARKADGSPVTLTNVRFIKVQTAVFLYGGIFGEVSTEIYNADGLGVTTDFPMPE